MANLKTFAEKLVNLSVKEVSELADILKDEYGIEPAATAVAAPTGGAAAGDAAAARHSNEQMTQGQRRSAQIATENLTTRHPGMIATVPR